MEDTIVKYKILGLGNIVSVAVYTTYVSSKFINLAKNNGALFSQFAVQNKENSLTVCGWQGGLTYSFEYKTRRVPLRPYRLQYE